MEKMKLPVLVTAYKRPKSLTAVLERVHAYGSPRVYISVDGINGSTDDNYVEHCRQIAQKYQADHQNVELRLIDNNLGCRTAMRSAIDWFFEAEEQGIVLEEDCVPHPDFFKFCENMLDAFRDKDRVFGISGDNSSMIKTDAEFSHGFSRFALIWGWASWRDRWQKYRPNLENWQEEKNKIRWLRSYERSYWTKVFDTMVDTGKPDSWAYPLLYTVLANDGLWVFPRHNLIKNIGFHRGATHTHNPRDPRSNFPTLEIKKYSINYEVDESITDQIKCSESLIGRNRFLGLRRHRGLMFRIRRKLLETVQLGQQIRNRVRGIGNELMPNK